MQLHGLPAVVVMVIVNQKYYISKLMKEKDEFLMSSCYQSHIYQEYSYSIHIFYNISGSFFH